MATLKLFAALREAAGTSKAHIDAQTLGALLDKARTMYGPAFSALADGAKVAVNGSEVDPDLHRETRIGPGDEVALLPPVSGGSEDAGAPVEAALPAELVWSAGFGAAAVLAAWGSEGLLAVYVALLAGWITLVLGQKLAGSSPAALPLASAVASASFPLWMLSKGEGGLMWAAGLAVLLVASSLLVFRSPDGAFSRAGGLVWLPLYVGFGLSYAVLITQQGGGPKLLLSAALILLAYQGSGLVVARLRPAEAGDRPMAALRTLPIRLAGVAAAEMAAMVSLAFLGEPYSAGPLAILGLVVALAAMLGEAFGRSFAADLPRAGAKLPPWTGLDAWILALPAFFYGFRLHLT